MSYTIQIRRNVKGNDDNRFRKGDVITVKDETNTKTFTVKRSGVSFTATHVSGTRYTFDRDKDGYRGDLEFLDDGSTLFGLIGYRTPEFPDDDDTEVFVATGGGTLVTD